MRNLVSMRSSDSLLGIPLLMVKEYGLEATRMVVIDATIVPNA